ncbi:MAG: hypothetical protein HC905_28470 [Bacteroidales bacterium]|nr:hypothetical protein [Bacteroidales bacterium]
MPLKMLFFTRGGFSAKYGGKISSVLDVSLKDGSLIENSTNLSIGTFSTKITHEHVLKKDTSSLFVSLRRCNIDLFARLLSLIETNGESMAGYTFYDAIAKYNYTFSPKDRLYFSFYGSTDKIFLNLFDANNTTELKYKYLNRLQWAISCIS